MFDYKFLRSPLDLLLLYKNSIQKKLLDEYFYRYGF